MFNSYFSCPVVLVKKVPKTTPVILITERLVPEGENFVLHRFEGNLPMVNPDLIADAVTAVERAKVGKVSPSASNFLSPSLEFQQGVAATLATLDDKFSYEAALKKINAAVSADSSNNDNTNQPKSE